MPVKLIKCATDSTFDRANSVAALLQTCLDPNDDISFGNPHTDWASTPGTVLAFRPDFRPLSIDTLETFVVFCYSMVNVFDGSAQDRLPAGHLTPFWRHIVGYTASPTRWQDLQDVWHEDKIALLNRLIKSRREHVVEHEVSGCRLSEDQLVQSLTGLKLGGDGEVVAEAADEEMAS